ncbi:MAG: DoxX family protein [Myxococcota bacterium]
MDRVLGRFTDVIYAALRFVAGGMLCSHGLQKTFGLFGGFGGVPGNTAPLQSQMGFGGLIELVGGGLVALGLFGPYAAFLCSGMMAVAYFQFHWIGHGEFWPILNAGELAALYCFVFLFIAARGSGRWSLDGLRDGRSAGS